MPQNYLVIAVCRPVGQGVSAEDITDIVYYNPTDRSHCSVPVDQAISQIESGAVIYFIHENGITVNLDIVMGTKGRYLRSDGHFNDRDSLLDMRRCVC